MEKLVPKGGSRKGKGPVPITDIRNWGNNQKIFCRRNAVVEVVDIH